MGENTCCTGLFSLVTHDGEVDIVPAVSGEEVWFFVEFITKDRLLLLLYDGSKRVMRVWRAGPDRRWLFDPSFELDKEDLGTLRTTVAEWARRVTGCAV